MTAAEMANNRRLYLRWLATEHQQVYKDTVLPIVLNHVAKTKAKLMGLDTEMVEPWQALGQNTLGFLADDFGLDFSLPANLSSSDSSAFSMPSDFGLSSSVNQSYPDLSSTYLNTLNYSTPAVSNNNTTSSGGLLSSIASAAGTLFSGIAQAAPAIGQAYVGTQSQLSLLQINSARAQQGLPPLANVNGTLVTASQLAAANPTTAALEGALTVGSSSTSMTTWLLIGGAVLLGTMLLSGRKSS